MFLDNPGALRAAAEYIERHRENPQEPLAFMRHEVTRRQAERRARQALIDHAEKLAEVVNR